MGDVTIPERIAQEIKAGTFNSVREAGVPSIPTPGSSLESLARALAAIKTILDQREGLSGSVMDANLTLRDLVKAGALTLQAGSTTISSASAGAGGVVVAPTGPTGYVDPRPYYATPPAVTALTAQGAFKSVILDWTYIDYQNFSYFEVWRSATNALGAAVLTGTTTTTLYNDATTAVGGTYYYWVRSVTTSGVHGPFNAVGGTVAAPLVVGNTDLGPLVVTSEKLSQGTYPNINLVPNASAEDGTVCWQVDTSISTAGYTFGVDTSNKTGGLQSFVATKLSAGGQIRIGCMAFPVIPGETYSSKIKLRTSPATAAGLYVQLQFTTVKPSSGYIDQTNSLASGVGMIPFNGPGTTSFDPHETTFTVPANMYWCSLVVISDTNGTNTSIWWDDVSVGRQITAAFLAANSIAVGTAAIQNGAINNLMFDRATGNKIAVVDADIVNLNGNKITANTITAGQIAANTIKASNILVTGDGGALNPDPGFTQGVGEFTASSGSVVSIGPVPSQAAGAYIMRMSATAGSFARVASTRLIPCIPGKTYRLSCWARQNIGTGVAYFRLVLSDQSGSTLAFNVGLEAVTLFPGYTHQVGTIIAPANTAFMLFEVYAAYPTGGVAEVDIQDLRVEEAVPASLIVDGTITTDKIFVTAATVAANQGISAAAVPYTTVTSVTLGATTVTPLTSTGQAVTVVGQIEIQTASTAGAPTYVVITATLYVDGAAKLTKAMQVPIITQGSQKASDVTIPLCFRLTPTAGAHNYQVGFTAAFKDAAGSVSCTGAYAYFAELAVQENKV